MNAIRSILVVYARCRIFTGIGWMAHKVASGSHMPPRTYRQHSHSTKCRNCTSVELAVDAGIMANSVAVCCVVEVRVPVKSYNYVDLHRPSSYTHHLRLRLKYRSKTSRVTELRRSMKCFACHTSILLSFRKKWKNDFQCRCVGFLAS